MAIVRITEPAEYDLESIENYISVELCNPESAVNVVDGILAKAYNLADFPEKHPYVNDSILARLGFRLTWYDNYNIFYIYDEDENVVHIIRVLYNRQDWQEILK